MENKSKSQSMKSRSVSMKSRSQSVKSKKSESVKSKKSRSGSVKSRSGSVKSKSGNKIKREEGELDAVYKARKEFIDQILEKKNLYQKEEYILYLHTLSFVHVYKKLYHYTYPKSVEDEYMRLLAE